MKSRDYVLFYINGERVEVRGADAFLMLSDFLRYRRGLTGTKVVCAEGDCGACTVLRAFPRPGSREPRFQAVNCCILPVFLADCSHLITIEGLREDGKLNELQDKMCAFNGAQCGFCTPGIVMALSELFENKPKPDAKAVKNYLTGNLCRCTGYQPIVDAACAVDSAKLTSIHERYADKKLAADLIRHFKMPVEIEHGDKTFFSPLTAGAAAKFKGAKKKARVYSAATDLGVHINKGFLAAQTSLGLNQVAGFYALKKSGNRIYVGAKVTLSELEKFVAGHVPEFESFLRIFASKQIKNVATLVGNVVNGSPIGDTLPFLQVADTVVELQGARKARKVKFVDFYKGYRKTDVKPDEIVTGISFEIPAKDEKLRLYKVSQRKDLDISCVNAGFRLSWKDGKIDRAHIAFGGVGPTVLSLPKTEAFLRGKILDHSTVEKSVELIAREIAPRGDVRGQADYRLALSQNLFKKFAGEVSP